MTVPGLARPIEFRHDELVSITYLSSSVDLLTPDELGQLLVAWRASNEARGVTGVLLYRDGNIVQVLEGPALVVGETFSRIKADPRHTSVIVLLHEPVESRAFPDWSMGYRLIDGTEGPQGHTDYLSAPQTPPGPAESAVERVLQVFRETCR